jgi:hypothetical protein
MSDIDTMRWGDTQTLNLAQGAGESSFTPSKQMLNAKWERPVVWRLMLSVAYQVVPADAGLTFSVQIFLQVGVGQASQQVPLATVNIVATSPATVIAPLFFDIPAEAMQVQFFVGDFGNQPNAGDSVTVTAMCAPHAEPGAVAQMRDVSVPDPNKASQRDREGMPRWIGTPHPEHEAGMPQGFDDGELRYRY